jgi:hypothetical protein
MVVTLTTIKGIYIEKGYNSKRSMASISFHLFIIIIYIVAFWYAHQTSTPGGCLSGYHDSRCRIISLWYQETDDLPAPGGPLI